MKKTLKNNEYALTILIACVKKNGGEIQLTEEELIKVKESDILGMYYDKKTKRLSLRLVDAMYIASIKPKTPESDYEN